MRSRVFVFIFISGFFVSTAFGYDWGTNPGTGEPNDPYQISTPEHLLSIGSDPNLLDRCFVLANDIVFDPNNNPAHVFTTAVIAPDTDDKSGGFQGNPFTGTFDGNGHTIRNLRIQSGHDYLGLFGSIDEGAAIKNLGVMNYSITGTNRIGGLAGVNADGTITNCSTSGVITGQSSCGGLIGAYLRGIVATCSAQCEIIGGDNAQRLGGLVGYYLHSETGVSRTLSDCHAEGTITAGINSKYLGGLIGQYTAGWRDDAITRCYAGVHIESGDNSACLGGLVGFYEELFTWYSMLTDSYATGHVTAGINSDYLGGLIGRLKGGEYYLIGDGCTLSRCTATGNVSGGVDSVCMGGLCGLSTGCNVADCNSVCTVSGYANVGGMFGSFEGNTIDHCSGKGTIEGISGVGGLVGRFTGRDFTAVQCSFDGSVNGNNKIGGLIGFFDHGGAILSGRISFCSSSGVVSAEGPTAGGLIGSNQFFDIFIEDCFSTSEVYGHTYVGGLIGINYADLQNCYATGRVQASSSSEGYAGGLIGYNGSDQIYEVGGNIIHCYATGNVTNGSGLIGYMAAGLYNAHVTHCYATGDVTNGSGLIGGCLVYGNSYDLQDLIEAPIESCYATGNVTGSCANMGGLIGILGAGEVYSVFDEPAIHVRDCYYTGHVSNAYDNSGGLFLYTSGTGGLIGTINSFGSAVGIDSCTAEADVEGSWWVGGLIGTTHIQAQLITVQNCHVNNTTVSGIWGVGGLIGYCDEIHLQRCSARSSVYGVRYAGGLIGWGRSFLLATTIENSFADTTIYVTEDEAYSVFPAGGLIGSIGYSFVDNSYATGTLYGIDISGGLIGGIENGTCYLTHNFAAMEIDSPEESGGLIGALCGNADITNCFWDMEKDPNSIDFCGDHGRTTAELMDPNTFLAAGWDFVGEEINGRNDFWRMCTDGVEYPKLSWEVGQFGDFACPDGAGMEDIEAFGRCWLAHVDLDAELDDDTDTVVGLAEVVRFGEYWLQSYCGNCGGMDSTGDGRITLNDWEAIGRNWLMETYPECGMADMNGDDIVDLADWAVFAAGWLEE